MVTVQSRVSENMNLWTWLSNRDRYLASFVKKSAQCHRGLQVLQLRVQQQQNAPFDYSMFLKQLKPSSFCGELFLPDFGFFTSLLPLTLHFQTWILTEKAAMAGKPWLKAAKDEAHSLSFEGKRSVPPQKLSLHFLILLAFKAWLEEIKSRANHRDCQLQFDLR